VEQVGPGSGPREIAEFLAHGDERIFAVRHRPSSGAALGIVICPGLQAEFHRNYRREVLISRALAESGVCVQRFHYRGSGHSDGDSADMTFSTMLEDAVRSAEWMMSEEHVGRVLFVGVRLGGLVAAAASKRLGSDPIVLWEPFTRADSYYRDIFRAARVHALADASETDGTHESPVTELRRTGRLDVLGYSVDRALFESLQDRRLDEELGDAARSVLMLLVSPGGKVRPEYGRLLENLEGGPIAVTTRIIRMQAEPWWLVGGRSRDEERQLTDELTGVLSEWIGSLLDLTGRPA
jgi:alpha/beta superfamily hydrolase